jgi:hypothetical protein
MQARPIWVGVHVLNDPAAWRDPSAPARRSPRGLASRYGPADMTKVRQATWRLSDLAC